VHVNASPVTSSVAERLLLLLLACHGAAGVAASRRIVVGLIILCAFLAWAIPPAFESPDWILVLTVKPATNSGCPTGSACFTLELRNRGPWPTVIEIVELQFYPSMIGPSVNVKWVGPGPGKNLVLLPFTGNTYTFSLGLLSGLAGPEVIYAILKANIVLLYVSRDVVLHSGKR
jgi:hypothetical protein